jgi:opacity protein-like surface antigen
MTMQSNRWTLSTLRNTCTSARYRHGVGRLGAWAAMALLASAGAAQAQSATNDTGYFGLQIGRSDYQLSCGALYSCDNRDTSYKLTYGRHLTPNFGAELGLMDLGKASRGGGDTHASAANLSLVGRLPMDRFTLYGKLGATYARTSVGTAAVSDVPSGKASGWGPSAGVGMTYDLSPKTSMVLEWERQRLEFANLGRQDVDNTSIGLRYRF